jgi:hypothetical protein
MKPEIKNTIIGIISWSFIQLFLLSVARILWNLMALNLSLPQLSLLEIVVIWSVYKLLDFDWFGFWQKYSKTNEQKNERQ